MEVNYFLALLRQYVKPIFMEAIHEYFATHPNIIKKESDPDRIVSTSEACKLMGFKDRHSIYKAVERGLPKVGKRPYRFRVSEIKTFMEDERKKGK